MEEAGPDTADRARCGGGTFRFAPSPNGYLHAGHAYSALLNARAAARSGGRFLLRIEDIDRDRSRPEYAAGILEDLAWLGLSWEEPVLRQSERSDAYREALAELDRLDLIYPAFLSRTEIGALVAAAGGTTPWPRDPDSAPHYPGPERDWPRSRRLAMMQEGRPYALRLHMGRALEGVPALRWTERNPLSDSPAEIRAADPAAWGDVILARRDAPASYHLAVVLDDALQEITHVVRGCDLEPATSVHRLIQHLFGIAPPLYFHHDLIRDGSGDKLAKSRGSESLRDIRARDPDPATLLRELRIDE